MPNRLEQYSTRLNRAAGGISRRGKKGGDERAYGPVEPSDAATA